MKTTVRAGAIALALSLFVANSAANESGQPYFVAASNAPLITLTQVHGMVRGHNAKPLVRVYADGTVRVHRPVYMRNAGDFVTQLDKGEFDTLLRALANDGLMGFDSAAVAAEQARGQAERRASSGEQFYVADSTITRIELRFAAFATNGDAVRAVNQTIEWADLAEHAQRNLQIEALRGLNNASKTLHALSRHNNLVATKADAGVQ